MPIKRHPMLAPVSRDHHDALLLCWKIKHGFSKGVEPTQMKMYADRFFTEHILPHFELEEQWVFTILDKNHELIQRALKEHRRLEDLFTGPHNTADALKAISTELDDHIRFEERILFPAIEAVATTEQLKSIEKVHTATPFCDREDDRFW